MSSSSLKTGVGSAPPQGSGGSTATWPVICVGASAGGLDACQKLLDALAGHDRCALVVIQHLEPHQNSLMAELLVPHTTTPVLEAAEGMLIEIGHIYVIPPGSYLAVRHGALHLTKPPPSKGPRQVFDAFLNSLADAYGPRAVAVVLSGTGTDGSKGMVEIKAKGGWTLAQDPAEARFDGMPKGAIETGQVDLVLTVARIAEALAERMNPSAEPAPNNEVDGNGIAGDKLSAALSMIKAKTGRDFSTYKPGTLARRIERRIGMLLPGTRSVDDYLELLTNDPVELDLLVDDLLIHVTQFFRDPDVFNHLARNVLPALVAGHAAGQPIRVWVAGCSTGEEAYSLVMLLIEALSSLDSPARPQVFASDIDPRALAVARNGVYPTDIANTISRARLDRFFTAEDDGYRVTAEVRDTVVFSEHDILRDPPFSHIDLVSCRNLLIYLRPDAQEKVTAVFRFALRPGGLLLLGNAETIGSGENQFAVEAKAAHLFRFSGRGKPQSGLPSSEGDAVRLTARPASERSKMPSSLSALAERLVIDVFAPAAVLVNARHEVLYTLGPVDRYLRIVRGYPNADLLAMLHGDLRSKVRAALQAFGETRAGTRVPGGRLGSGADAKSFEIEIRPLRADGEELALICFVDVPGEASPGSSTAAPSAGELSRVAELERELSATRIELADALRSMDLQAEEQKAIHEEALSINEEYQSANEELLTSKEELQSLNEELIALNGQLQETLERQRTTSDDLQNVLYSTDAATIFLDTRLNIRFFTPATRALFSIIPTDVGRPLADLRSLATDDTLPEDAAHVLETLTPVEREIEIDSGSWFLRRVLPYRTQTGGVEGVVITFADVTESRRAADDLRAATILAERANTAKSRFLAAASHDLRQPLQTLSLVHGMLATGGGDAVLMARFDDALSSMSDMLNTLLDINQIEAGSIRVAKTVFPIADLLDRLFSELAIHASAKGLAFRYVRSSLWVESDPRLLEQMVRNLVMNALKYTRQGAVLLGCRRKGARLSIEVSDTGIGIPASELDTIFEEYHQVDNVARQHSLGLGLGLSIVQRVGDLLGHVVGVRSKLGVGSTFSIDVDIRDAPPERTPTSTDKETGAHSVHPASLLLIEDDGDVCDLLAQALRATGYRVAVAADGAAATTLIHGGVIRPDLVITDYNLPNGRTGVEVVADIRNQLHARIPAIVLTGDVSTRTLAEIAGKALVQLVKPVSLATLLAAIAAQLPVPDAARHAGPALRSSAGGPPIVFVVDDDDRIRDLIEATLSEAGHRVETFADSESYLAAFRAEPQDCMLVDAYLPGMSGLDLLRHLNDSGNAPASVMITGGSDVLTAVEAMKAGALDFVEKPIGRDALLSIVNRALGEAKDSEQRTERQHAAARHVAGLTTRQRQIMELVLAGHPSKNIAADLFISQRTVENHRAAILKKTGARSLPELARLAVAAALLK